MRKSERLNWPKATKDDTFQFHKINKMNTSKVTRVEVIDHQSKPLVGRAYVKYDCKNVEVQLQDDGRTLKIFISN